MAAKAGSNYTQPALRFTAEIPIEVVNLWGHPNLRETLGMGGKVNKKAWEKIEKAEKEYREAEQKKKQEEYEKLSALYTQTANEVQEIFRGY